MRHVVVMVTTSYPRFPGDSVGTFMEPIAKRVAARGHEVHVVAPWHPRITRGKAEDGVYFHFFKYAPLPALNVFGYAEGLRADVRLKSAAWLGAPLALTAGWFKALRVAQKKRATVMHGHWVVPGGVIAAAARPSLPLVVSLHGSDVFVAERTAIARAAARRVFDRAGFVTACSQNLADRAIAIGAAADRLEVVPYGVDVSRFKPAPGARDALRTGLGIPLDAPLLFTAGRLVRKKGFEYLIDALPLVVSTTPARLVIAGSGDLAEELRARAAGCRRSRPLPRRPAAGCGRRLVRRRRLRGRAVGARRQRQRGRPAEHRARGARVGDAARLHTGRRHRQRGRERPDRRHRRRARPGGAGGRDRGADAGSAPPRRPRPRRTGAGRGAFRVGRDRRAVRDGI
jgi:glycosyltransferase involved in cell wall biosynthesis